MIHPSIKVMLVLVLLLTWAAGPVSSNDCDDPFDGSSCQNQHLSAGDGISGGDECGGGPIAVTSAVSSGTTLSVSLSNPTASTEQGFLVASVLLGGHEYGYAVPVSVAPESTLSLLILYPGSITTIGVDVCANRPGGINESPDVVGIRQEQEPE